VRVDCRAQLFYPLAAVGAGHHHWAHSLCSRWCAETDYAFYVVCQLLRTGQVGFVYDEDVGHFHDAAFHSLNTISASRRQHQNHRVGDLPH
jgi:hypothetical protein